MKVIYIIAVRDLIRFFRTPSRPIAMLVLPMLFIFVLGTGIETMLDESVMEALEGVPYREFLLPGMLGMMILFSSFFSSLSIVWDKEFGFIRELLVAPVSRLSIVLGKVFSGAGIATLQGTLIATAAATLGLDIPWMRIPLLIPCMALLAIAIASLGVLIASRMGSMEGFQLLIQFMLMPMVFLSGMFYPLKNLPDAILYLAAFNPLTYGIDLFKHALLAGGGAGQLTPDFSLTLDVGVIGAVATVTLIFGSWSFTTQRD